MSRSAALGVVLVALISVAVGMFTGCDENKGKGFLIPNNQPSVRLTAFPPDSGTAGYDVSFYWEGWDTDGEVDHFIYAIDPPDMYGSEDSVWTRTDDYSGSFLFQAVDFDTLYSWREPQVAKSWHVFVIRAVDDMGAISDPDYLAFNAATVAPRTQFTTPPPMGAVHSYMGSPQEVGLNVTFRWSGDDLDGLFNDVPVAYLFKVLDVSGKSETELVTFVQNDTTEWIRRGGGVNDRKMVLDFDDGHNYAVAVRAIDEAGAVEPLLLLNGNMMWVGARGSYSFPELTVRSSALGTRTWQGWGADIETYEATIGSRFELAVSGNADLYGGLVTGYSFAWDLIDLETNKVDPNGLEGWTPWSLSRKVITAELSEMRDYFLYIRCKDDGGSMTLSSIRFHVIPAEPTKNLCYIDDWRRYPRNTRDGEALDDEVWQTMLEGYNYGEDWDDVSWDEWDEDYSEEMPSLEFLSKFQVVVWSLNDNRSTALNQQSAWYQMNSVSNKNVLAAYMTGRVNGGERGKVWIFGRGVVESSLLCDLGVFCGYPYIVDADMNVDPDCGIRATTFVSEFMHITGEFSEIDKTSGGARINLFSNYSDRPDYIVVDSEGPGIPSDLYTRPPAAELYPNLPSRINPHPDWWVRTSGYYFEVLEYPGPDQEHQDLFYDPVEGKMTGLIPLYRVHARSSGSGANNKYCAFRYIPAEPEDPGEIVYFFFPMFPWRDSQIRATAKVVLSDWFGLPDPDAEAPGAGAAGMDAAETVR
jgi:hypothetical protein